MKAPSYMSPTERPSWSAMTISTSEGGMIWGECPGRRDHARGEPPVIAVSAA